MLKTIKLNAFDFLMLSCFSIVLLSCDGGEFIPEFEQEYVEGYAPVYGEVVKHSEIQITESRQIIAPGKIITYNSYIIIEEVGSGYHVINNIDNTTPVNVGFLSILNSSNIAIRDNTLYVDSKEDLLAIQLNDDMSLDIIELSNVFGEERPDYLPPESGYYECVDDELGDVVS